jgi:hypothetical protein
MRPPVREGLAFVLMLLGPVGVAMAEMVREFDCRFADLVRRIEVSRVIPERPLPCEVIYKKPIEEPGVSRVLWDATRDPAYCERKARELVRTLETGGWACTAPAPGADGTLEQSLKNADPSTLDPALRQAVSRDLETLKARGGKRVAAKFAALGDLDGDGVEDAVALITFDVEGPDRAQYLVAYLFEDGDFRSTASRFIGGRFRDVYDGEVEGIEDGAIMLHLRTLEPGDGSCCPSGRQRATFVLREGELVRAE